jgi:hypothetical protein
MLNNRKSKKSAYSYKNIPKTKSEQIKWQRRKNELTNKYIRRAKNKNKHK